MFSPPSVAGQWQATKVRCGWLVVAPERNRVGEQHDWPGRRLDDTKPKTDYKSVLGFLWKNSRLGQSAGLVTRFSKWSALIGQSLYYYRFNFSSLYPISI
jgi:hypothetical protein